MAVDLFRGGMFTLHSGKLSDWKIDCDALNVDEWKTLARIAARRIGGNFSSVWSPGGAGEKFASHLRKLATGDGPVVIADDVLTTGTSITNLRDSVLAGLDYAAEAIGVVVFARGPCPAWVTALFQYTGDD